MAAKPLVPTLLLIWLLPACTPDSFGSGQFDRIAGDTRWRVADRPDGFQVTVLRSAYHVNAGAGVAEFEDTCRKQALALAAEEASKRGGRVDPTTVRADATRDRLLGVTTCTGTVSVASEGKP
jgi:hypothetical protein